MTYRHLLHSVLLCFLGAVIATTITVSESSQRDNRDFYDPTPIELKQGTAFAAPRYWGVHLRKSKSLRVAFIGGSQTSNGWYFNSFREIMNTTASNMGWSFAAYNEGNPGTHPSVRPFKFLTLSTSKWPNVICIEPCLNCGANDNVRCSSSIDNLRYFINHQYEQKGLDSPYYVFLEFFRASWKYYMNYSKWLEITDRGIHVYIMCL